jgi:FkbM family methyltransferase
MMRSLFSFYRWSAPWRKEFGNLAGLRVAAGLRRAQWAAPAGSLVSIAVPALPYPIALRAGSSDTGVFDQVFRERQADFAVDGEPKVIVDAGANSGLTAARFATRFPGARILALEIDGSNFELLQKNTRYYPNVEPIHKGLWACRTRIRVDNPAAESWAFQASVAKDADDSAIEALGVLDLMADYDLPRIDVLKIDIEGAEYEVFSGGIDAWIDRVDLIAVETHDRMRPGCTDVIRRAIAGHGFEESIWSEYLVLRRPRR